MVILYLQINGVEFNVASDVKYVQEKVASKRKKVDRGWFSDSYEDQILGYDTIQKEVVVPRECTKEEIDAIVNELHNNGSRKAIKEIQHQKAYLE